MDFPREVVQLIYTVNTDLKPPCGSHAYSPDHPALDLRDRARGQAVCRAWREWLRLGDGWEVPYRGVCCLSPFRLPLLITEYPPLGWVQSAKPALKAVEVIVDDNLLERNYEWENPRVQAVHGALAALQCQALERLELRMRWPFMEQLWPVVCRFPRLRRLLLTVYPEHPNSDFQGEPEGSLGGRMLAALPPSVEHLAAGSLERLEATGPGLLPALEELHLNRMWNGVLDAALPSLGVLELEDAGRVRLGGGGLALPQLTRLRLEEQYYEDAYMEAELDFSAMAALAELKDSISDSLSAVGGGVPTQFSALQHLTLLTLGDCKLDSVMGLLRHAPPTLQALDGRDCHTFSTSDEVRAALGRLVQLTRLHLHDASIATYLEPLQELRELHLEYCREPRYGPAGALLCKRDIAALGRLRGLRRLRIATLRCPGMDMDMREQERRLQALARALPKDCAIESLYDPVYSPPAGLVSIQRW